MRFDLSHWRANLALPDTPENCAWLGVAPPLPAGRSFGKPFKRPTRQLADPVQPKRVDLMEAGQRASIKDDEVFETDQRGVIYTIAQVVGQGADAFVSLLAPDGTLAEWFRADELQPAMAQAAVFDSPASSRGKRLGKPYKRRKTASRTIGKPRDHVTNIAPVMTADVPDAPEEPDPTAQLIDRATRLSLDLQVPYAAALRLVMTPKMDATYRELMNSGPRATPTVAGADRVLSLARDAGAKDGINLRTAVHRLPGASLAGYRRDPPSVLSLSDGDAATSPAATIETKARELMAADRKLSYSAAVLRVQQDDPELYRAWKDDRDD